MSNELRPQDQDDNQADLEDDPLAELARIVAGEPEPEPVSQPVAEEESTVEPEPDTLDAVEEHASVADLKADTLDSIDKQLEQVEKNLESALSDEFEQADLPETPVSVAVEDSTVVEAAEEVTPASSSDDDGFLDGLRTAIDGEIEGQLADAPEEQSFPSDPEGFEDDLISALSLEVEAANQDVVQNDALDDLDAHVEQSLEDELGATLSGELADPDVSQSGENLMDSNPQEEGVYSEEPGEVPSEETVSESPDAADPDLAELQDSGASATPEASNALEEDLGAVFANEFEQILASAPAQASADVDHSINEIVPDTTPQDTAADHGMDFGKAFAEELGVDNLVETQGWDTNDTIAANAAFAEAAQAGHHEALPQDQASGGEHDPAHSGNIPGVDDGSAISGKTEGAGGSRKYAIAALLIALFAGSIAAGYGFLGTGEVGETGSPQLVKADDQPFKVKPEDPGGRVAANQDKASYERVEGEDTAAVEQETLVSDTEEPATVDESKLVEVDENKLVEVDEPATNAPPKTDERLSPSEAQTASDTTPKDLAPRMVQTVTVKPDGTIVKGPAPDTPNAIEEAPDKPVDLALNTTKSLTEGLGEPKPVETVTIQKPEAIDGARSTGVLAIPEASPLPKPKPVAAAKPAKVATAKPAPQPAATPKSDWVVQVSSQRSPEAARASYSNLRNRFSELQGRPVSIQRANVNGSTFYRVRVQTASRDDATKLCNSLQSSGGSCFVTR